LVVPVNAPWEQLLVIAVRDDKKAFMNPEGAPPATIALLFGCTALIR
jgi:hypothetical protein